MSYNDTKPSDPPRRILIVRLGAMGDVIHALPAAFRLKHAFPAARLSWAIEPRWAPLLEGSSFLDEIIPVPTAAWRKRLASSATWSEARSLRRRLREASFDAAIDFQGLLKSAVLARLSGASRVYGFARSALREPLARHFYSDCIEAPARHVVDKNLALAAALGANSGPLEFPLPLGIPQADLPAGEFVLASPVAGWKAKQWPPQYYARLAELLYPSAGMTLLLDCAEGDRSYCEQIRRLAPAGSCHLHVSSLEGLIAATRRARAVVGIDSGPLHLAAALGVRGVAIFGQTDPARNGPYGDSFTVLRAPDALTSYKREDDLAPSMSSIRPEQVWQALEPRLASRAPSPAAKTC
jgi:lipopolysaccharide heptosyltransferase I